MLNVEQIDIAMNALRPFATMWEALVKIDSKKPGSDLLNGSNLEKPIYVTWGRPEEGTSAQITLLDLQEAHRVYHNLEDNLISIAIDGLDAK